MIDKLKSVVNTLNNIEIKGADNMNKMLGCIQTLVQIINEEDNDENSNTK